jgi:hypothetical protein
MLHYFYTLDYPSSNTTNGENGHINSVHNDDSRPSPTVLSRDYSIENEQFIEAPQTTEAPQGGDQTNPARTNKKKNKKKRGQSMSVQTIDRDANGMAALDANGGGNGSHPGSSLVLHAKVYSLGSKYGVAGLKTLSADKFTRAVESHWDGDDFLGAAREAYSDSTDADDRSLRDVVLSTIDAHKELMQRKPVLDVIKDIGQLSYDLLMLRVNGLEVAPATPVSAA